MITADRLLPQVLAAFNRLNPSIEIQVECNGSVHLRAAVREGKLDVAIVTTGNPGETQGEVIRREPLYWVSSSPALCPCHGRSAVGSRAIDLLLAAHGH